ncbi:cell wall metabolism sensor histidine kinase WalK [Radiobacillus kanasensis]|uniref:cell wall metabolism sensor histidine kinase WalK n=1 Tax=Radiobacillus kanasensis TaxID=2844358 RepID=UPI001E2A852B|nr:cell wall metabolism sensor histidine kinase WalK [Radiobacillus kanasensis]UFT99392.1 cell wall metabolism sensor histidine kinase WalK [Radiobacillus kanasensis]
MKKVGFFQSIQLKFIVVLILLLLLAIQVIGAYFVRGLEESLQENFDQTMDERVKGLKEYLEQAFSKERAEGGEGPTLQQEVSSIIDTYDSELFTDLKVIDNQYRVIGTNSDPELLGKRITDERISKSLLFGTSSEKEMLEQGTLDRIQVRNVPITNGEEVVGAIYIVASLESIYDQLQRVNEIFMQGTIIAVIISAILGILVARTITKPISEMRTQASILATGDFSQKVNVYGNDEIGQLGSTFNDMSDRLRQAHLTTEGERRKLSSVLSNMSDGVIATDTSGLITLMNESAEDLLGTSFEDVKGKLLTDVLNMEEEISDVLDTEITGSRIVDLSDDEQFFLIRANFSAVQDEDEHVSGFITVISDVTEQEKVEKERREFVSNVSHELRTPLTTMRSYIEALTDGAWEDKEIAPKFLNVTQTETDRMIRLVNDLLQLSKMDNKGHTLYKEKVDFVPYFHHIIDRFEMNKSEDILFERQLPRDHVLVWLDKDKMTQVIDNIISNAVKYSPEGGKITFKIVKERRRVVVSITDQGVGIAKEKLDKIFERFYRADKARARNMGGTGLGLAIAKELVEAHNGHIWAESKEGKGTTISFILPLMQKKRGNRS